MANHLKTGIEYERLAEELLLASGSRVLLERNYRLRTGEIDLILEETRSGLAGNPRVELVFVEVRVRNLGSLQDGIESVDWKKRKKLCRTIRRFLVDYRGPAHTLRVDILAWDGKIWTHLPDAWILD